MSKISIDTVLTVWTPHVNHTKHHFYQINDVRKIDITINYSCGIVGMTLKINQIKIDY